ncbi:MAG: DUF512 domain-containing protein [Calditrichaeota bacterium]|nr:MAG: DUF512 domain-containing protein [Calditrichota bacterium]
MVKIHSVDPNSIAEELDLRPGDRLRRINGQNIRDILDYRYYVTGDVVELEVERDGQVTLFEVEKDPDDTLGINLEPLKIRMCGNDCPFCFVDQNPAGMRKGLYFRDEDYRLSFLSGHYVTMTNLSQRDLDKIVTQRLSPLYISVHAIQPEVRKFLLGIKHDDRLLEKLEFLTQNGIELHTQIVVCPGINDGEVMDHTIHTLAGFFPGILSIALVPLGLTKHRDGLTPLKPVSTEYARKLVHTAEDYAYHFKQKMGKYFVYPSDEFYIMAGIPVPSRERYDAFDQLENGVGMVRQLLDDFQRQTRKFPRKLARPARITLVTGKLMGELMQHKIVEVLNRIGNLQAELVVVENKFYGDSIRVTGLLTGQDIFAALKDRDNGQGVYLPANCVNDASLFLDDWSLADLADRLETRVQTLNNDFTAIFQDLQAWELAA